MSQEEDSLDSLLGNDNLQEIHLDDIEADMSLDALPQIQVQSHFIRNGRLSVAIQSNQAEESSEKKEQSISTHASDEKQLSELELDVLTIEDIIETEQVSPEDESLNEDKYLSETNDTSKIDIR